MKQHRRGLMTVKTLRKIIAEAPEDAGVFTIAGDHEALPVRMVSLHRVVDEGDCFSEYFGEEHVPEGARSEPAVIIR